MTAMPPVLVCDGPANLPRAAAMLAGSGWTVRLGFALPDEPWDLTTRRWACQDVVGDCDGAEAATWALVRGCGLIVAVTAQAPADFLMDVARGGSVEQFPATHVAGHGLDTNVAALLAALADGQSMQQAAAQLFLSERTAQRRLASARAALGVRTTREAVVAWTRLNRSTSKRAGHN